MRAQIRSRSVWLTLFLLGVSLLLAACGGQADVSEGSPAPDFTLTAADGSSVSLSDFSGQPVLLYFHMAMG